MRKLLFLLTGIVALWSAPVSSSSAWETSLDTARARAQRENKPLLVLELFGRLDEELC